MLRYIVVHRVITPNVVRDTEITRERLSGRKRTHQPSEYPATLDFTILVRIRELFCTRLSPATIKIFVTGYKPTYTTGTNCVLYMPVYRAYEFRCSRNCRAINFANDETAGRHRQADIYDR